MKNNIVFERLWMLCVKYRRVLAQQNVWQLDTLLSMVWYSLYGNVGTVGFAAEDVGASPGDDGEVEVLLEELRITYERLAELGISKDMARTMLWEREKISRMLIKGNGTICLPELGVEVRLTLLQWSLYVLFVRHSEGIDYKHLPDHREELMGILTEATKKGDALVNERRLRNMVDKLTDPTECSINETVSRIRRAFIDATGSEECARHYYINGVRGGVRRIPLDRGFIEGA